ncbi:MAG: T9SS type A sorting domain-containing protein [Fibrobacter sp.]|nr:T9SS type A sorting domain-containing protein [Fibrobacter sp.]
MEELVFSSINDYFQYANMFFYNTDKSFLERDNNYSTTFDYVNSLLIIYLYHYAKASPGIDFIRQVFYNSHNSFIPFYSNIEQTSNTFGFSWPELLNKFHTASFFSGSRADSTKFIPDGNLLAEWFYTYSNSLNITLTINPYAMEKVFIKQEDFQSDTLIIHTNTNNITQQYAASVILRKENADTLFPIPISSSGKGSVILDNWNNCTETGIIVTNGSQNQKTDINVSFEYGKINFLAGDSIAKKQFSSDSRSFAEIHVKAASDLRGDLAITETDTYLLMQQASAQSLLQQSAFFTIDYPEFWNEKSSIQLTMGTLAQGSLSVPDSTNLYVFNQSDLTWHIVETNLFIQNDTIFTNPVISPESATYCIFSKSVPTEFKLVIYPNPFSLRKNKNSIIFDGTGIKEIVIYDLNGNLVKKIIPDNSQFQTNKTEIVKWDLKNRRGKVIIPGLYVAAVSCYDNSDIKNLRQKILVVP